VIVILRDLRAFVVSKRVSQVTSFRLFRCYSAIATHTASGAISAAISSCGSRVSMSRWIVTSIGSHPPLRAVGTRQSAASTNRCMRCRRRSAGSCPMPSRWGAPARAEGRSGSRVRPRPLRNRSARRHLLTTPQSEPPRTPWCPEREPWRGRRPTPRAAAVTAGMTHPQGRPAEPV
jgi:hypothetical protein